MKFKVGDYVEIVSNHPVDVEFIGNIGIIMTIMNEEERYQYPIEIYIPEYNEYDNRVFAEEELKLSTEDEYLARRI